MNEEVAEIIARAITAAAREIGTGDAATSMGGLEFLAVEIREGTSRIAEAILDLAEATRGN